MDLPPEILSTVKESTGCQIIGFTLATTLFGITVLQGYLYFCTHAWTDSFGLKTLIALLLVFDTLTTLLMAHALYTYNVLDFGDPLKQFDVTWSYSLENGLSVVIAFIVQCYFGCRLWLFSRKNRVLISMIFLMTFGNLFGGLWITIELFIRPAIPELGTVKIRILTGVCNGCSSLCDILIAGGLCYYLQNSRSGLKRSDSVVDRLILYAINRGILTTVCQVMHLITVIALPGRVVFLPFAMLESKLYTNVLLATLNVRQSLRGDNTVELRSTSFTSGPSQFSGHTPDAARPGALQFRESSVATVEFTHPTLQNELKKPTMSL